MTALFDAHLHPMRISDQDLESLAFFGVQRALAVTHSVEEPSARTLRLHWDRLVEEELPRLKRAGIQARAALGIDPRSLPRRGLSELLSVLPDYFRGAKVAAIGETGLQSGDEAEEEAFLAQLDLAKQLHVPVVVHTPFRDKERLTRRILVLLRLSGVSPAEVLVDHASGRTVRLILARGHQAGLSIHPESLTAERAALLVRRLGSERLILSSDAGDPSGELLGVPRALSRMAKAGLSERVMERVAFQNASSLFWDRAA